jgi:hypothetical protein
MLQSPPSSLLPLTTLLHSLVNNHCTGKLDMVLSGVPLQFAPGGLDLRAISWGLTQSCGIRSENLLELSEVLHAPFCSPDPHHQWARC